VISWLLSSFFRPPFRDDPAALGAAGSGQSREIGVVLIRQREPMRKGGCWPPPVGRSYPSPISSVKANCRVFRTGSRGRLVSTSGRKGSMFRRRSA